MVKVNVVGEDGVITNPKGGKWVRCDTIKRTGQFVGKLESYWKCHKKLGHEGRHKDVRGRNKEWD